MTDGRSFASLDTTCSVATWQEAQGCDWAKTHGRIPYGSSAIPNVHRIGRAARVNPGYSEGMSRNHSHRGKTELNATLQRCPHEQNMIVTIHIIIHIITLIIPRLRSLRFPATSNGQPCRTSPHHYHTDPPSKYRSPA